jgi:aspartyl-tRNA(Asn)/glutamyl-tRNA(Gln) amidotransferase subunit B
VAEVLPEGWEAVVGMEVHVQLATRSKMFCGCSADYLAAAPNSNVCEICLGLPGVLPVVNRRAVELGVRTALALGCEIARFTRFDRKNYFYPDLPKGYQISQYDLPIGRGGRLEVGEEVVRITRVHLEEDTGKLLHSGDDLHTARESLVDLNRAGVPLMEIVSEPDIRSAAGAREYAEALRELLRAIGASEADMEKGQLRAEANVSVRRRGEQRLGVKTELKNINSFRFLQRAVESEIRRQVEVLESGGEVVQETRGWSEALQGTVPQRTKEYADDYRYFPEPDLPPLELDRAWVEELRATLPELPAARRRRLRERYGLSEFDVVQLSDPERASLFEAAVAAGAPARSVANWIVQTDARLPPRHLAELVDLVERGVINREQGMRVLAEASAEGIPPAEVVHRRGLGQVSDAGALARLVDEVLADNPRAVADFRAGKRQALGALLGEVRKRSGDRANMQVARDVMLDRLH